MPTTCSTGSVTSRGAMVPLGCWGAATLASRNGLHAMGFTQWAATKQPHPVLKTIVPAAAVAPGIDFPRENGIVVNFQFGWAHYVGNDSLLDVANYRDEQGHSHALFERGAGGYRSPTATGPRYERSGVHERPVARCNDDPWSVLR